MTPKRYAAEHIIINGKDNMEPWLNRYFIEETEHQAQLAAKEREIERLNKKVEELLRRKDVIERAYRGYGTPEEECAKQAALEQAPVAHDAGEEGVDGTARGKI